jgi:hypothetical protein
VRLPAAGSARVDRQAPFPTICCFYNCGKKPGSDKVQRIQHPDEPRWVQGSEQRKLQLSAFPCSLQVC